MLASARDRERPSVEVVIFPNTARPNVGLKPRRHRSRPTLPTEIARHPPIESANGLGYLVYAPLEAHDGFQIEYLGAGQYRFVYFLSGVASEWRPIFSLLMKQPLGAIGTFQEAVRFHVDRPPVTASAALKLARTFIVPEDLDTPPGAVSLRGAWGFRTPEGWDTVYGPVCNTAQHPAVPVLTVRVETDWYVNDSEFRYVLIPGEGIRIGRETPIGQVFFLERGEIGLTDAVARRRRAGASTSLTRTIAPWSGMPTSLRAEP